jgi:hypothetical protein
MNTRPRQLDSGKWVAEVKIGCCDWWYIDPMTLEARMPVMSYEDWFEHPRYVDALDTLLKYEEKNK